MHVELIWLAGVLLKHKWENCMTIDRDSWGYRRNAELSDFMEPGNIITALVETVRCAFKFDTCTIVCVNDSVWWTDAHGFLRFYAGVHILANLAHHYRYCHILRCQFKDNVYGAVIMAEPLREFTRFIWWM